MQEHDESEKTNETAVTQDDEAPAGSSVLIQNASSADQSAQDAATQSQNESLEQKVAAQSDELAEGANTLGGHSTSSR